MSDATPSARIALLNVSGAAVSHVRDALRSLGARVVYEAAAEHFDRAALQASGADVVIVNLGSADTDFDATCALLDDARYRVIFNEGDVSGALSGWNQARWTRHLAAKIGTCDDIDPPRPPDAEAVPARSVTRGQDPMPGVTARDLSIADAYDAAHNVRPDVDSSRAGFDAETSETCEYHDAPGEQRDAAADFAFALTQRDDQVGNGVPDMSGTSDGDGPALATHEHAVDLSGIDELLSNFDAALDEAERRERDAGTVAIDEIEAGDHFAADSASDLPSSDEDFRATSAEVSDRAIGFRLALADDDAPIVARAPLPDFNKPAATVRAPEQWSLAAIGDEAEAIVPTIGKAIYTARDIAHGAESAAEKKTAPAAAPTSSAPQSAADTWLSSLQLEPIEDDATQSHRSVGGSAVAQRADTVDSTRMDAGAEAIRRVWVVGASAGSDAVREFLAALKQPVSALVVVVEQGDGTGSEISPRAVDESPIERTVQSGDRVVHGDVVRALIGSRLHIDARDIVAIEPDSNEFPYRSSVDRSLCDFADTFTGGVVAIVLDGAPADALQACRHVIERGGKVYAQDSATCRQPATLDALATAGIATVIAAPAQLAAAVAADD